MMFRRITPQEANVLLPLVAERAVKIQSLIAQGQILQVQVLAHRHKKIQGKSPLAGTEIESSEEMHPAHQELESIDDLIREELLQLQKFGAHLKSVSPICVDFIGERHRQPVCLCWKMNERAVTHWHPTDEDYTTRRKITNFRPFGNVYLH